MEDSKKKQIKFKPEYSAGSHAAEQPEDLSYVRLESEEKNTRQMTLEEFCFIAREGVKGPNVN